MTNEQATPRLRAETVNLGLFLVAVATLAVVANFFAARPWLRVRMDATKTRAYSLSPQTRQMLDGLSGDWTVAVVAGKQRVDQQALRQVDEILERFAAASEHVGTVRLDPTDPDALGEYEALLSRLQSIYGSRIEAYDRALASAAETSGSFVLFAQRQTAQLARLAIEVPEDDPRRNEIQQMVGSLQLRLQQAEEVGRARTEALTVDESRPLADYESARSLEAAALTLWADEIHRIAQIFQGWRSEESLALAVRQHVAEHLGAYEQMAIDLASAADPLKRLEPLEIASIGRSLEQGAAAIVLGPRRDRARSAWRPGHRGHAALSRPQPPPG
jgi:hypothetical protein